MTQENLLFYSYAIWTERIMWDEQLTLSNDIIIQKVPTLWYIFKTVHFRKCEKKDCEKIYKKAKKNLTKVKNNPSGWMSRAKDPKSPWVTVKILACLLLHRLLIWSRTRQINTVEMLSLPPKKQNRKGQQQETKMDL